MIEKVTLNKTSVFDSTVYRKKLKSRDDMRYILFQK